MRCFDNIARLIREKRLAHPKAYSQSELSGLLGYKNGQFISNVERGLCNIPLKMLTKVSEILDIPTQQLREVMLKDLDLTLGNYLNLGPQKPRPSSRRKNEAAPAPSTPVSATLNKSGPA